MEVTYVLGVDDDCLVYAWDIKIDSKCIAIIECIALIDTGRELKKQQWH